MTNGRPNNPVDRYDVTFYVGDTWRHTFLVKDDAGDPYDLTGWTAKVHIRLNRTDTNTIFELTEGDGITVTHVEGKIELLAATGKTSLLTEDSHWDLQLTQGSEVWTIAQGVAFVAMDVTRP